MRFIVTFFMMIFISGCNSNHSSGSKVKLIKDGASPSATNEDNISGVCLLSKVGSERSQTTCTESTLRTCSSQRTKNVRVEFVSSADCKCYALEQSYLSELKRSMPDEEYIASDEEKDPVGIGGDWSKFYQSHPECVVSPENTLSP